jgi:hypothetical protein
LRKARKSKFKKWYLFLAVPPLAVIVLALVLYKPARYRPIPAAESNEASLYLTNELLPEFYNGLEREEPFELIITEEGINDIIERYKWPKDTAEMRFSVPQVLLEPDGIVLMGTVASGGLELVMTVEGGILIDVNGLMNLWLRKVKVGAINITPLAKMMAKRAYENRLATTAVDMKDFRARIAKALIEERPFEPVFEFEGKKARVAGVWMKTGKMVVRIVPQTD